MADDAPRVSTGVPGLDEVLDGGLLANQSYMVRGASGTGKTIFGYHFLDAGLARGERGLYVALEEPADTVRRNAARLGFDLEALEVVDLTPDPELFVNEEFYSVFGGGEVEGLSVAERIVDAVDRTAPDRVFIDPLTQLRRLSPDDHQYNQFVASMMSYLKADATVLFSTQSTPRRPDDDLQYLSDGSVTMASTDRGRSLRVEKFRGSDFRAGTHALTIGDTGLTVYPKLVPGEHRDSFAHEQLSSGVDGLDALLHGGVERGTITLVSGPSGVGKSTTVSTFAREAARRGERSAVYLFEETSYAFLHRSEALGILARSMLEEGTLGIHEIEPLVHSSDEFAHMVRREVEENDTRLVVIDGTSGYRVGLQDEDDDLVRELHGLCRYLRNIGATVLLTEEIHEVWGPLRASDSHVSYLADNVLFLRYVSAGDRVEKAVGVLKKRLSDFEPTLRPLRLDGGYELGEPLDDLRGVLTGVPAGAGSAPADRPDVTGDGGAPDTDTNGGTQPDDG